MAYSYRIAEILWSCLQPCCLIKSYYWRVWYHNIGLLWGTLQICSPVLFSNKIVTFHLYHFLCTLTVLGGLNWVPFAESKQAVITTDFSDQVMERFYVKMPCEDTVWFKLFLRRDDGPNSHVEIYSRVSSTTPPYVLYDYTFSLSYRLSNFI